MRGMTDTAVWTTLPMTLPVWATRQLVGDHPPLPGPWTCDRCPHGGRWPCPVARAHAVDLARETPMAGRVWFHWCWLEARRDLVDEPAGAVYQRMLGWYDLHLARVNAYRGNRGSWWRRPYHGLRPAP